MKFALALLFLAGVCQGRTVSDKIVGGEETDIEEYPYIVAVESLGVWTGNWGQSCAANLLTTTIVLSAAHCFDGSTYLPERRRIRAGSSFRNTGGQVCNVQIERNHPTYGSLGLDGDVSVIRLGEPVTYNQAVQPGAIISQGFVLPDHTPVIHAGWGTTSSGGSLSERLRDVTIYTINHELCTQRYAAIGNRVTENMICAGILDVGGKDACQGDSGGPLYYKDATGRNIIVGVVSWGRGCADAHFPGVSAAVSPYTNWIIETAASL